MRNSIRPLIFLSHWGEDGAEADRLAREIESRLDAIAAIETHVFDTSRPADRFKDFRNDVGPGENWQLRYQAWAKDLRAYLHEHLDKASAYLLLLTPRAMARGSQWVRWEIREGTRLARERGSPFVPCLLGVAYEALMRDSSSPPSRWQRLEVGDVELGHPEAEFQGLRVDEEGGLMRLIDVLSVWLRRGGGSGE